MTDETKTKARPTGDQLRQALIAAGVEDQDVTAAMREVVQADDAATAATHSDKRDQLAKKLNGLLKRPIANAPEIAKLRHELAGLTPHSQSKGRTPLADR